MVLRQFEGYNIDPSCYFATDRYGGITPPTTSNLPIPISITVISKYFTDSVLGTGAMITPFRAMGFSDVGYETENMATPFRTMEFADASSGLDGFNIPFKSMSFSVSGLGLDSYDIPFKTVDISDIGYGIDTFSMEWTVPLSTMTFGGIPQQQ